MASKVQVRDCSGSYHHQNDDDQLTSTHVDDPRVKITTLSLYVNIAILFLKILGGYAFYSEALKADAAHAFTDLTSDCIALAALYLARKPPTVRFPYGYGKIESLGSVGVSGLLLASGIGIGWTSTISLLNIYSPAMLARLEMFPSLRYGHHHHRVPDLMAIPLVLLTISAKEWLYHATLRVAREHKSSVLASNAVHHRADALTGIVTIAAVVSSNWEPELAGMDALGGLLISALVIRTGLPNTWESILELVDGNMDKGLQQKVRQAANDALKLGGMQPDIRDLVGINMVSGTKAGRDILIDLELAVPETFMVSQTKETEETLRKTIRNRIYGVKVVRIQFVPRAEEREGAI